MPYESITLFQNRISKAHKNSSALGSELVLGNASKIAVYGNIIVPRPDRKALSSYSTKGITFSNNLFSSEQAPEFPPGTRTDALKNGDFSGGTRNWDIAGTGDTGKDARGRFCLDARSSQASPRQTNLSLQGGFDYTLKFEGFVREGEGDLQIDLTGLEDERLFSSSKPLTSETETFQISFYLAKNVTGAQLGFTTDSAFVYCLDTIELVGTNNRLAVPQFVNANTDPLAADFRLQDSSPAKNGGTTPFPATDITGQPRPDGDASDLGAYEGD